jgi:hypothetical protein
MGRFKEPAFYEKGRQVAQRLQLKDSEASYVGAQAYALAMFGQPKKASETANAALALAPSSNVKFYAAGCRHPGTCG